MSDKSSSSGIGFWGMLTILFIGLKLTGYITWSWWWVFAPIWAPLSLAVIVAVLEYRSQRNRLNKILTDATKHLKK